MTDGAIENKTYKMEVPKKLGETRYEELTLHSVEAGMILSFNASAGNQRTFKEWLVPISASSGIPIGILEKFDSRDIFGLIEVVQFFLVPARMIP